MIYILTADIETHRDCASIRSFNTIYLNTGYKIKMKDEHNEVACLTEVQVKPY